MVAWQVDFIDAYDAHCALDACGGLVTHRRTEEDTRRRRTGPGRFGIDDLGCLDALGQEADAPIDLAQETTCVTAGRSRDSRNRRSSSRRCSPPGVM